MHEFAILIAAGCLVAAAPGQTRRPQFDIHPQGLVLVKKNPALGIGLIVVGGILLLGDVNAQGGAGGGSGSVSVDDTIRLIGGGLVILGLDQVGAPPSWTPKMGFAQRRPAMFWTVSRW